jgi:hypothetical protein
MYGSHCSIMAAITPLSLGTLLTVGWIAMAVVTCAFLTVALAHMVRPGGPRP